MNTINKDTRLYGSFSTNPGNNGCAFFNRRFQEDGINAIYRSFYSEDIRQTISSVKHLRFSGFALSAPHKVSVIEELDDIDQDSKKIGAVNTVVNDRGRLLGFNTDWIAIYNYFKDTDIEHINLIGLGGFGKAIVYALSKLNITISVVPKKEINSIDQVSNQYFINATPVEILSDRNTVLDMRPSTNLGKEIALIQAEEQYKIYRQWMK